MITTIGGCDPSFRKDGFAICIIDLIDRSAKFKTFKNGFIDFANWLLYEAPENAKFYVENSNKEAAIFRGCVPKGVTVVKYAQMVGKNQAASQYTCDVLKAKYGKENVIELSPKQKGSKITIERVFSALVAYHKLKLINYNFSQDQRDSFQCAIKHFNKIKL